MTYEKKTKEESHAIREAFLTGYRKVIDKIMDVLDFAEEDRMETEFDVVLALQRAINFAEVRTGVQYQPQSTSLYKIANILHDVKTWDEFARRVKTALPKEHPIRTLRMYKDLTFKVPFDVPEFESKATRKALIDELKHKEMLHVQETVLGQTLAQQVQAQEALIEKITREIAQLQHQNMLQQGLIKDLSELNATTNRRLEDYAKDYIYPLERQIKHLLEGTQKQPPPYNPELFNKMAEELRSLQKVFGVHSHDDKGEVLVKLKYLK